jgi:hypothetical protein
MNLARKKPMARGSAELKRTPMKRRADPKPRRTTPPKVKDTPRPRVTTNAKEKAHMGSVAALGCLCCINLGHGPTPAEVHHVRCFAGAGQRSTAFHTIPLCPIHHRHGGSGVAVHAGIQSFERIHGTERELLAQALRMLGFHIAPEDLARPDLGALLYPPKE